MNYLFNRYKSILLLACLICVSASVVSAKIRTDGDINREAKHQIESAHLIGVDYYDISTKNGVIYLKGKIETDSQAAKIIEISQSIEGVKDVNTKDLIVASSHSPIEDTYITAKIKGLYIREKLFANEEVSPWTIKVETKNCVVYLSGHAKNDQEIKNAIRLSKSVEGVKRVESSVCTKCS